jgi:hypothetical protein
MTLDHFLKSFAKVSVIDGASTLNQMTLTIITLSFRNLGNTPFNIKH